MNINTSVISGELLRLLNAKYSLLTIYSDAVLMGNLPMIHSLSRDVSMIHIIYTTLVDVLDVNKDYEYTDTFIMDTVSKGREYISALPISYVDYFTNTYVCALCPNFQSIMPNVVINSTLNNMNVTNFEYNITYTEPWKFQDLTVDTLGQTTITGLTINLSTSDMATIIFEVDGDNPLYTISGIGYHIEGTTLYWHNDYRLRPDMQLRLRWKLI